MTTTNRPSLRKAVNAQCRECLYDPVQRGAWREQIAACASANCSLHPVRPVPRHCMEDGRIVRERIAEIRAKLGC